MVEESLDDVVAHLVRTTPFDAGVARRIVEEVVAFFDEPAEVFVRRRHRELKAAGMANPVIFEQVRVELAGRPVAAPDLTERQIRRLIYG